MHRRGAGVSAIAHRAKLDAQFKALGVARANERAAETSRQLRVFTESLEHFAATHRAAIRSDPEFRAAFHSMCAAIGVDPLASRKSAWGCVLGFGDFYVELGVRVVEACIATRAFDGGLCALDDVVERVNAKRGVDVGEVSVNDVELAIEALSALGGGWRVETPRDTDGANGGGENENNRVRIAGSARKIVVSVPMEINDDIMAVIAHARAVAHGCLTVRELSKRSSWTVERSTRALDAAVKLGVALVDDQHESGHRAFWFPAFRLA